jgi:hypothetical protein
MKTLLNRQEFINLANKKKVYAVCGTYIIKTSKQEVLQAIKTQGKHINMLYSIDADEKYFFIHSINHRQK